MNEKLIESLLPVNCAYNYKEESRNPETTEMKCYSTSCMLNANKEVAEDIQTKGCKIYQQEFVQKIIKRKTMSIIEKIIEAVYELHSMNCNQRDLIISFSPLVERLLIDEMQRKYPVTAMTSTETISGVKTYNLWPYNEIVVYDAKNVAYNPKLIKKIEVSFGVKNQEFT